MLNESVLPLCMDGAGCCDSFGSVDSFPRMRLVNMQLLENASLWKVFQAQEAAVAEQMATLDSVDIQRSAQACNQVHPWLERLETKNELNKLANTRYMYDGEHGTSADNVPNIVKDGLSGKFAMANPSMYGKGIYLTTQSCKADQYTGRCADACVILVCRVTLGQIK